MNKKNITIGLCVFTILLFVFLPFGSKSDRSQKLAIEIQAKQQEYARIAGEKIEYERACAIAFEKSQQLLLLHGQAERLRAERALVLAQMGKEAGTQ